jgi:predicted secreted protein
MTWVSYAAIYLVVWALCLFVVLPFGVRSQHETGSVVKGSERGAPVVPMLWRKVLATTVLAAIVTAGLLWLLGNPVLREYWS